MKFVELLLEILGWLQIVVGVTLAAGLIAFAVYWIGVGGLVKYVAIAITAIGFVSGCIWATIIWNTHGTINWLSRIRRIS